MKPGDLIKLKRDDVSCADPALSTNKELFEILYDRVDSVTGGSRLIHRASFFKFKHSETAVVIEVMEALTFPYIAGKSATTYLKVLTSSGAIGWMSEAKCELIEDKEVLN